MVPQRNGDGEADAGGVEVRVLFTAAFERQRRQAAGLFGGEQAFGLFGFRLGALQGRVARQHVAEKFRQRRQGAAGTR